MKTTPNNMLITGALVARKTITLGLGHTAEVEIRYDGPNQPAPSSGTQWPPEHDWPAAKITLRFPGDHHTLEGDLQCDAKVLDDMMLPSWGYVITKETTEGDEVKTVYRGRSRWQRRIGTSLRNLAAEMLKQVVKELRPVQAHLRNREIRLRQREATLLAGMDIHPITEPAAPAKAS